MRVLSRGGGTVDSGSSDVEYWKIKDLDDSNNISSILYSTCNVFKVIQSNDSIAIGGGLIALTGLAYPNQIKTLLAIGFLPFYSDNILCTSLVDYFKIVNAELNPDVYEYLTPITKEEFYDLNNI